MKDNSLANWFSDGWTITKRNMIKIKRVPEIMVFTLIQPIMFVLLFSQVYGGSIQVEGIDYTQYLMAGIFAQTVVFGSTYSGSAMAQDLKDGIIDRFRTLPMHSAAVLVGRTNGDLTINALAMLVMMVSGYIVGWRINSSPLEALGGVILLLAFSYAFSWVMVLIGMSVKSSEVIQNVSFIVLFPLTFISNAFVQPANMPKVLQVFAEWNPVSALVQAARESFGNIPAEAQMMVGNSWTMRNAHLTVTLGIVIMLLIFVPLSVKKFKSISSR